MEGGTATREWKKDWTKEVWNVNWPDEQMISMGGNLATIWVPDTNDSKYEMITLLRDNQSEISVWSAEFFSKIVSFKDDFLACGMDVEGSRAVLCGAYSNSAYSVWDLEKGEKLRKYDRGDSPFTSVVIREGSILMGHYNGISIFDLETGRPGKKLAINADRGFQLCKDPTRPSLYYAADITKSTINAYDARTGGVMPARSLLGLPQGELAGIRMRGFGKENMLVAATDKQVRVFDVTSGKTVHTITHLPQYRTFRQVDIVKDYVICALDYEGLHFYNIATGDCKEPEYALNWSGLQAYNMAATPDAIFINYVTSFRRAMLP